MIRVLISSCLLGEAVRYDGGDLRYDHPVLERWRQEGRLVMICPELEGGLPVPRAPCEIPSGEGVDVLDGRSSVVDSTGTDVTAHFLEGSRAAVKAADGEGVRLAILAEGSPSCGKSWIYDGTFSGRRRAGAGVTAARLRRGGMAVYSQFELEEAAAMLADLEFEDAD